MTSSNSEFAFLPIAKASSQSSSTSTLSADDALAILLRLQDSKAVGSADQPTHAFKVAAQRFLDFVSVNSNNGFSRQDWNLAHSEQIAQVAAHGESLVLYLQVFDQYNLDEKYFKQPRLGLTKEEIRIACNRLIFCPFKSDPTDYFRAEQRESARDNQLARIRRERKPAQPLDKSDMAALLKAAKAGGGKRGGGSRRGADNKSGSGNANSGDGSGNGGGSRSSSNNGSSSSRSSSSRGGVSRREGKQAEQ